MPHGATTDKGSRTGAPHAWPALVPATLGLFLFDVGYHFARPVPTGLSSVQDVTLLAGQALATLAALVLLRRAGRLASGRGTAGGSHAGAAPLPRRIAVRCLAVLAAVGAALSLLAELAILGAPGTGTGLFPAYTATALSGLGFGACFVAWVLAFACAADPADRPSGAGRRACLALLAALAASRAADTLVRQTLPSDMWLPLGMAALDASLVLLAALVLAGRKAAGGAGGTATGAAGRGSRACEGSATQARAGATAGGGAVANAAGRGSLGSAMGMAGATVRGPEAPASATVQGGSVEAPETDPGLVGLTGATLFSALFGLMTQVHNVSQGVTGVPDYVSCIVTLLLFIPLATRVALVERPLRLGDLFLASLPVAAGILIVVALVQGQALGVADALIKSLFNVYFAATLICVVRQGTSRAALGACALLAVWAGVLAGSAAGFAVSSLAGLDTGSVTAVALACVWLCTLASTWVARTARGRRAGETDKAGDGAEAPQQEAPAQPAVLYVDRVEAQAARLAGEYGLSPREAQVVALLARGRSAARIAEELVLSESTVKTHLQNAYGKAGVHSKQELLDKMAHAEHGGSGAQDAPQHTHATGGRP